jgi:WhiB family transcriptional regulator, redox-sensing transcriptional regulator
VPRLITGGQWRSAAACRSADPDLFFPISDSGPAREQTAQAKAICATCRVRRECLAFALRTGQVYGIWGGTTEHERAGAPPLLLDDVGDGAAVGTLDADAGVQPEHRHVLPFSDSKP